MVMLPWMMIELQVVDNNNFNLTGAVTFTLSVILSSLRYRE